MQHSEYYHVIAEKYEGCYINTSMSGLIRRILAMSRMMAIDMNKTWNPKP